MKLDNSKGIFHVLARLDGFVEGHSMTAEEFERARYED